MIRSIGSGILRLMEREWMPAARRRERLGEAADGVTDQANIRGQRLVLRRNWMKGVVSWMNCPIRVDADTEACTKSVGRASNPWQVVVYQNIAVLINYYGN
jgi:hypothetical protein